MHTQEFDAANKCFTTPTILRTISTSIFQETAANAVIDLQANDDDRDLNKIKCDNYSTFLQEWDAFYNKFVNSTTYALMQSSTANLMPSLIVNDNNDNLLMSECSKHQPVTTNSFNDSLCQLCHAVQELEKVNN